MSSTGAKQVRRGLTALLPRLWRFAMYLTRDTAAAEDLVQATCLRALEKASQYAADTKLDSWTFTIMVSIWKNTLRSASTRKTDATADVDSVALAGIDGADLSVYARQVLDVAARLPAGQRAVIALVCVERWSYKETAAALDIPIGTVMSRLASARKALAHLRSDAPAASLTKGTMK